MKLKKNGAWTFQQIQDASLGRIENWISTDKTSLKADREDWGGLLKTPAKHRENERQRDHSHRGARGTKGTNEIP